MKKKALVVDNEKITTEIIAEILKNEGLIVEKAYGGLEALEKLKNQRFDVVFLDLIMPRIDGGRICSYIKQSPRHESTKVVIITACAVEAEQKSDRFSPDVLIAKSAVPKMKENIIKALTLFDSPQQPSATVILGREGMQSRTIVKELLFSQSYFETILDSMSEGVIELDNKNIITYVNPAAQNILNKKEWDLIGSEFTNVFGSVETEKTKVVLARIYKASDSITEESTLKYENMRELSLSFKNVIRDGKIIGATVVINDITEKNLLEKERYLRERLTGVMEMAITAAHELNQPLAVISGNSQLLLKYTDKKIGSKTEKYINSILEQVDRLAELTKKFSRVVSYKTKEFGRNIKIVDIDEATRCNNKKGLKGMWE
jgi:PAS domain S-box-containing protein